MFHQVLWYDGKYFDVPYKKNHLVVNIGKLLVEISGGQLRPTLHRVMDTRDVR